MTTTAAKIRFTAKVQTMYNVDGSEAYKYLHVPEFARRHCDMPAFRAHPRFGSYANSDLFSGMLRRIRQDVFGGKPLRLDAIPEGVQVDASGFLAIVTITV